MRRLNSGLPEFSNYDSKSATADLVGASPESILPIVVMDSGLDAGASPRNDKGFASPARTDMLLR
jgi:hypothetical protein